jgi:hypothetical protein
MVNKPEPLTTAEVIDRLDEFRNKTVRIIGRFEYHFEDHTIQSGDRKRGPEDDPMWFALDPTRIWTNFPSSIAPFELKNLAGKNVILKGRISRAKHGAGHLGMCHTAIMVHHIEEIHTSAGLTPIENQC